MWEVTELYFLKEAPFVQRDNSSKYKYSGYTIDVLVRISEMLNFTFEIDEPEDGQYGIQLENGNWSGMIGELQRGVCFTLEHNTAFVTTKEIYT